MAVEINTLLFPLLLIYGCSGLSVDIVTVLPYNFNLSMDVVRTGAALDLSAEAVNRRYHGQLIIKTTDLYNTSHRTCEDIASKSAQMIAEHYATNWKPDTCFAVVTTSCTDWTGIISLANGYDWPIFVTAFSASELFSSKVAASTAIIGLAGTYSGYITMLYDLLRYYGWYHSAVILEQKSAKSLNFYKVLADALLDAVRQATVQLVLSLNAVDVTSCESITAVFGAIKKQSRVIILLMSGNSAVKILGAAKQLNMTNGEYVFINVQPLQGSDYGLASQFSYLSNDSTLTAYRSFFFVAYRPSPRDVTSIDSAIEKRAGELYNFTYKDGIKPLATFPIQSSYNLVELLADLVVNGSSDSTTSRNDLGVCGGLHLASEMVNRSFSLTAGDLYINAQGFQNLDVDIFGFSTSTMSMQTIAKYLWYPSGRLVWQANRTVDWPTANRHPPKDVPECGFTGTEGPCATKVVVSVVGPVAATVVGGLIVTALAVLLWRMEFINIGDRQWWLLRPANLHPETWRVPMLSGTHTGNFSYIPTLYTHVKRNEDLFPA